MKILLINPARMIREGNVWKKINPELPPMGLSFIASFLEKQGMEVRILDLGVENFTDAELAGLLRDIGPGITGISSNTVLLEHALKTAALVKETLPGTKVVMGGTHPSIFPEEVLACGSVDYVVRNEGELTLLELAKGVPPSEIKGLSYRSAGGFVHNPPRPYIENLDEMPLPAYHLLPMDKYRPSLGNYSRLPAMSIITSRGCPGRCTFCYTGVHGKRIRFRSAESILEEINLLIRDYGIKEICFYDDTFTANRENVKRLCGLIAKDKVDITWTCMSRIDFVDGEILSLMKKAGCHQIGYGIESADEAILGGINKSISLSGVRGVIKMTQKCGIDARAMFIFGSPGETEETMKKTLDFAISIEPDIAVFNITTPYPGTEMFAWAKERGFLGTTDWTKYDLSQCVMNLPTVKAEKVDAFYRKAYRQFYIRPSFIMRKIWKIRTLEDLKMNIKAFYSMLGR